MKTQLTAEQSAKLIEKGVSAYRASAITACSPAAMPQFDGLPVFMIQDLLEILPKEVERNRFSRYTLCITIGNYCCNVGYAYDIYGKYEGLVYFQETELIDALYSLAMWCAKTGQLKQI